LSLLSTRPPPRSTLFPYTTLFRSKLYALSTAGSIVGTLGASFLLIPFFGVRSVLHGLGIALLLLALAAAAVPSGTASRRAGHAADRKSTRLNSSHVKISYAVFCLK